MIFSIGVSGARAAGSVPFLQNRSPGGQTPPDAPSGDNSASRRPGPQTSDQQSARNQTSVQPEAASKPLPESRRPLPEPDNSQTENPDGARAEEGKPARPGESDPESTEGRKLNGEELDDREEREVEKLKRRDQEVRKHEQAHVAAAGQFARGGIKFEFDQGPDGKRYAVGGSVNLDTSNEAEPERTIQKMQQVRAAALAPAQPSPKDLSVAQSASKKATEARRELSEQQRKEIQEAASDMENTSKPDGPSPADLFGQTDAPDQTSSENVSGQSRESDKPSSNPQETEPTGRKQESSGGESFPEITDPEASGIGGIERLEEPVESSATDSGAFNSSGVSVDHATLGSQVDRRV